MREIRSYGSEGGGAVRSPYPYRDDSFATDLTHRAGPNHPRHGRIFTASPEWLPEEALRTFAEPPPPCGDGSQRCAT